MFDFLKTLEYHVGVTFDEKSGEFHSNVTTNAADAYDVAKNSEKDNPHNMILYVKMGKETKEIPYSEIKHLNNLPPNQLEKEIEKISRELFKKTKPK